MESLSGIARSLDALNEQVGRVVSWAALLMVLVQFFVVLMRYAFGVNYLFLQESIVYLHATLFLLGAGYTLHHGGHVRVDIFYRTASQRTKALIDLGGVLLFLLPVCGLLAFASWDFVAQSWAVREGSVETSGIPLVYLLKTLILMFCALMALQGMATALHALVTLRTPHRQRN